MRTIKFRGKDRKGEWQEGFLVVKMGINYILTPIFEQYRGVRVETDRKEEHEVSAKTVGQFTGLTDKNGKEIYEGDIVKVNNGTWGGVVLWNSRGYFYIKTKYDDENPDVSPLGSLHCFEKKQLEIVGNIHDNPEFMGGGEK